MEDELNPKLLPEDLLQKQINSFKLIKNTKGYNWEIKVYDEDLNQLQEKVKMMNNWARLNYESIDIGGGL